MLLDRAPHLRGSVLLLCRLCTGSSAIAIVLRETILRVYQNSYMVVQKKNYSAAYKQNSSEIFSIQIFPKNLTHKNCNVRL